MFQAYKLLLMLLSLAALWLFFHRKEQLQLAAFDKARTLPLRGALALLVVIGHCDGLIPGNMLLHKLHMSTPAVAVFFFLSGYGLLKTLERDPSRRSDDFFLARSVVKLGIPLLVAAAVMCACLKFEGRAVALPQRIVKLVTMGINFPPHSWFVYALFLLYACFFVSFRWLSRGWGLAVFFIMAICYVAVTRWCLNWPRVWWYTALSMPLGSLWALHENRIRGALARYGWRLMIAVLAALFVIKVLVGMVPPSCPDLQMTAKSALHVVMGPLVALSMYVLRGVPRPAVVAFSFLGTISFEIYLLHFVGERCVRMTRLGSMCGFLAVTALAILLAYPAHKFDAWAIRAIGRCLPGGKGRGA